MDSTSAPDGRFTRRQAGRLAGAALGTQLFAMPASDICFLSAVEMAALVRRKKLSAREMVTAHLEQIERVNPKVNAVVTLVAEQAMEAAKRADEAQARGSRLGALHGLPVAHKDLLETAGIRTTYGSPLFRDNVPAEDAILVERVKRAGAITIGKTNTPEFGAGSQTFNAVFGATHNPYDLSRTCGGSSGGAAVALSCGMTPLASGSDTGGSLRNPAAFCSVVGLRPAPGRVPVAAAGNAWSTLSVSGPMARSVADLALLLSVIAGPDARCPISITEPGAHFADALDRNFKGVRVRGSGIWAGRRSIAAFARRSTHNARRWPAWAAKSKRPNRTGPAPMRPSTRSGPGATLRVTESRSKTTGTRSRTRLSGK